MNYGKAPDPFYSSMPWRRLRKAAMLRDHGMCVDYIAEFEAGQRARPSPATLAHHIIPITERPDLALDIGNVRCVCDDHHNKAHPEKGVRGGDGKGKPNIPAGVKIVKI